MTGVFTFHPFCADARQGVLLRDGEIVALAPKAFDLLLVLIDGRGRVISKEELMTRVWPDSVVEEANLSHQIYKLREALSEGPGQRWIETIPRRGYRFAGPVTEGVEGTGAASSMPTLRWGDREIPLAQGVNLLGRTPECLISIDAVSVSRQHARIIVNRQDAVVEDLRSKNGTFVNGTRIVAAVALRDGDEIRLGTVPLTFHTSSALPSTRTVGRSS
ncbi:MAG: FHA domain-containing protein [Vicinamibacterales bacterium]